MHPLLGGGGGGERDRILSYSGGLVQTPAAGTLELPLVRFGVVGGGGEGETGGVTLPVQRWGRTRPAPGVILAVTGWSVEGRGSRTI